MRRDEEDPEDDSMPGQDSFIDVICNMVGILITLVVVVGMRVSQMVIEPPTEVTPASFKVEAPAQSAADVAKLKQRLEDAVRARRDAEHEIETAMLQAVDMRANAELVEARREQLSLVRAEVERSIAQRRAELDAESQRQFDAQREIAEARIRLEALTQEQLSLVAAPTDVEEIESVPTPLAKTVTGDEIHVRLRHGQLAVVPVEALLDEVERRGGSYLRGGLAQRDEATDTYGPVDGFRLRLSVQRFEEEPIPGAPVNAPRRSAMVLQGVFVPTAEDVGVAVEQALLPSSAFSAALRSRKSAVGAVTVWTYPDSYGELRLLKKAMWEAGVPLAVRPLAEGQPIIFSTLGSKSAAQ
ncbi:MAG TPA: hypothetical protein VEQ85_02870 [Lacipirellulaceae bacterium]|nr:hypothetical protein [Lacipirellulaceae bacterium]